MCFDKTDLNLKNPYALLAPERILRASSSGETDP
jgi:hypothetical protein